MSSPLTNQNKTAERLLAARENLFRLFKNRPMTDEELLVNLGLFMRSGALAKILFLDEMYRKIIDIPGIVCEFGVWRGQSLAVFENLRAVHEPYNYNRKILGFDTFAGYPEIGKNDVASKFTSGDAYKVGESYETYLAEILDYHEQENVMSHVKKTRLIKGDAVQSCREYMEKNGETIVALAFFDMALYEPTKACLEAILPRLIKGSVIVFDELCHPEYPGETKAAMEVLQLKNHQVQRSKYLPDRSYVVIQ